MALDLLGLNLSVTIHTRLREQNLRRKPLIPLAIRSDRDNERIG